MKTLLRRLGWLVFALSPVAAAAQENVTLPTLKVGPAIQQIATASSLSTEQIGALTGIRELPDGRVLVNDGVRRRLLLMDTTLKVVEVVLDSLSEVANTYGTRPGALLPFRGDTTLFIDPVSYAMVMIDGAGKVVRVRSVWRVQDVPWVSNPNAYGWADADGKGRIVYRISAVPAPPKVRPPAGVPWFPQQPDSAFVVAADLDTRMIDTLGSFKIPKSETSVRRTVEGYYTFDQVINPLPVSDGWAVLSDSRVAFLRWRDYRIDYLNPDGTWTSSAKLPYEWQPLNDDEKMRIVDSVKVAQDRVARTNYTTSMIRWVNMYGRAFPQGFSAPQGYVLPPGLPRDWILPDSVKFPPNYVFACPPGVEPPPMTMPMPPGAAPPATAGAPGAQRPAPSCMPAPIVATGGVTPRAPTVRPTVVVQPLDLPDFRPPFPSGSVRADLDGNLWVRINLPRPIPGGPVFDIIDSKGELATRLQIPTGYTIVGFGKGKVVYLSMRDATGIHLARVRLK